jgi:two-component system chemotaxis response regulator CheB
MPAHDIVVIGASAGGIEAVSKLVRQLPADLPAAVFLVIHIAPTHRSHLAAILNRAGPLSAVQPEDGQRIERGRIYVAAPNHHLLIKDGFVSVVLGPKENRHRPAIDPLFRTAARVYGSRVVGIVLSGAGDDGVAGLRAINDRGGVTMVQDPADAAYGEMPRAALEFAPVDHVLPVEKLGALLVNIVGEPAPMSQPATITLKKEAKLAEADVNTIEDEAKVGQPSAFSCPDCGGVLWQIEDGDFLRYRCRVGHSYSAEALADEHDDAIERGLWAAFRALEENASHARQLGQRALRQGRSTMAERFAERAEEAQVNADAIRRMILQFGSRAHAEVAETPADPGENVELAPETGEA